MRKIISVFAALVVVAILISACSSTANNTSNAANKPANSANVSNASNSNTAVNSAAVESDIKKAVADMAAALQKGDAAHFEKLYTSNYMFVGPDGSVASGKDRIESMKSGGTKYDTIQYDDVTVRVNPEGNGAVSISRATVKGLNLGKAVNGQYRVTHVWSKSADGWHLASGQTTAITAAGANDTKAASNTNSTANTAANANK